MKKQNLLYQFHFIWREWDNETTIQFKICKDMRICQGTIILFPEMFYLHSSMRSLTTPLKKIMKLKKITLRLAPEGISNYDVRNKLLSFYVFFTKRVITQQGNISPAMIYAIHGYKKNPRYSLLCTYNKMESFDEQTYS